MQRVSYMVQSSASTPNAVWSREGNLSCIKTVTSGPKDAPCWTHTLVISMIKTTTLTMHTDDVAVMYSFFGNIGGAYTLLTLFYGVFFAVKSPNVHTQFSLPGVETAKGLLGMGKAGALGLRQWSSRKLLSSASSSGDLEAGAASTPSGSSLSSSGLKP